MRCFGRTQWLLNFSQALRFFFFFTFFFFCSSFKLSIFTFITFASCPWNLTTSSAFIKAEIFFFFETARTIQQGSNSPLANAFLAFGGAPLYFLNEMLTEPEFFVFLNILCTCPINASVHQPIHHHCLSFFSII